MAEPTVVDYNVSTFTDSGITDETTGSVSWQTSDIVLVFGCLANNNVNETLANPTTGGSGLTFGAPLQTVNLDNNNNDCRLYLWSATASGTGSGTISSVTGSASAAERSGLAVIVYRGATALGTPVTIDGSTAKTITLTTTQANSHVALMMGDYAAVADVVVDATPTGTVRTAINDGTAYTVFCVTFGDQGASGTPVAYGITNHTGTVDMSGIAVEIKGTVGGGPAAVPAPQLEPLQRPFNMTAGRR